MLDLMGLVKRWNEMNKYELSYKFPKSHQVEKPSILPRAVSESGYPIFSKSTNCDGSVHSQGVLAIRLSAGATSLSPSAELAGETGEEDICGTLGGKCAAEPPSAVLTVISGDIATIISRVELEFSVSSWKTAGVSEGCNKPAVDMSRELGVQFICRRSHMRGMLRWIFDGSQSKSTFSDPDAMRVILSKV